VVADAGETTGLTPRAALVDLALVLLGLAVVLALGIWLSRIDQVGLAPREVLSVKAREILGRLGYTAAPTTIRAAIPLAPRDRRAMRGRRPPAGTLRALR
jgi:hypothetical protein